MIDPAPLRSVVADWAERHHCPSISWGVVADGSLALADADGSVSGHPPDAHTVYRIASMTKSFSAALTLMLRDDGLITLDTPIDEYAPELGTIVLPTADSAPITVRDLLGMTGGLVTDDAWADRHLDLPDEALDRAIREGLVFAHAPGNTFEYSNFGFALLGRVIHRATGVRLQTLVTERLLKPLGLTNTTWVEPPHDRWAPPLRRLDDRWVEELPTPGDGTVAPMGGLWTDIADLATWVAWLADAFPARNDDDTGPLSRASRREMQTAQRYAGMKTLRCVRRPTAYGYGVVVADEPGHGMVLSHSGGLPGYGSAMRWHPGSGVGVLALSNVTYAPMTPLVALLHDELARQLPVHTATPPPAQLHEAAVGLVDILNRWAAGEVVGAGNLAAVFAANVEPDDSFDRRATAARRHGELRFEQVTPINDARATVICSSPAGRPATVEFALAPVMPPRIQDYEVTLPEPDDG